MKYIPSHEVKEQNLAYGDIDQMSPWVLRDGSLAQLIKKYFHGKKTACLDIGCGSGTVMEALAPNFENLHGLDLSNYLLPQLKNVATFHQTDLNFEKLPFADNSVDLVTAFQVIEHLENPFFIMREIHRILKPGGFFFISVPNPYQITFKVKYLFTDNMPPWTYENNHLLFLTNNVFRKTYLSLFDLKETIYQSGAIPFWGRLRTIFGKKLISKHNMSLPRSKQFGRRVCYILQKPYS